jgi:hypothetical protein
MAVSAAQVASAGVATIVAGAVSQGRLGDAQSFPHRVLPIVWCGRYGFPAPDEDSTRIDVLHQQWRPITENIEQFTGTGDDNLYQMVAIDPNGLWVKPMCIRYPAQRRLVCGTPPAASDEARA